LYWYDSNKAVDGCAFNSKEPGALEMDWLDVQLELFRSRGMQVWLSGHVPPTKGNYFPDCVSLGESRAWFLSGWVS
jgi:endopolyphosphatase